MGRLLLFLTALSAMLLTVMGRSTGVNGIYGPHCKLLMLVICDHIINAFKTFLKISTALNNNFQADCSDVFRFLIGLSIPKLRGVYICMGYNGKVPTNIFGSY